MLYTGRIVRLNALALEAYLIFPAISIQLALSAARKEIVALHFLEDHYLAKLKARIPLFPPVTAQLSKVQPLSRTVISFHTYQL
jgi:hypothetical protein